MKFKDIIAYLRLDCSVSTLRQFLGFYSYRRYITRKKLKITQINKAKRLRFVRAYAH